MYALVRCFPKRGHGQMICKRVEGLLISWRPVFFTTRKALNQYCSEHAIELFQPMRYVTVGRQMVEKACPRDELFLYTHHWYGWRKIWVEETDE
jgi:hypothetical protein